MELDGKYTLVNSEGNYHGEVKYTPEMKALKKDMDAILSQYKDKKSELDMLVKRMVKPSLPEKWDITEISHKAHEAVYKARTYGFTVNIPEKDERPYTPDCPYERIRTGGNMVQILNSGVLTKAEKRKVLGLPEEDKPRQANDGKIPL